MSEWGKGSRYRQRITAVACACVAFAALLEASVHDAAHAQNYPVKPVRIINPFSPDGSLDLVAGWDKTTEVLVDFAQCTSYESLSADVVPVCRYSMR